MAVKNSHRIARRDKSAVVKATDNKEVNITPFRQLVLALCAQIPHGKVASYKAIAEALQTSPRAVGNAIACNPYAPSVPCHRIVAASGNMQGYFGGTMKNGGERLIQRKIDMLRSEGVKFCKDTIVDRSAFMNLDKVNTEELRDINLAQLK